MAAAPNFSDHELTILRDLLTQWFPSHKKRGAEFYRLTGRTIGPCSLGTLIQKWKLGGRTGHRSPLAPQNRVYPCDLCGDPAGRIINGEPCPARFDAGIWGLEGKVCYQCSEELIAERQPERSDPAVQREYAGGNGKVYDLTDEDKARRDAIREGFEKAVEALRPAVRPVIEALPPAEAAKWILRIYGPIVRQFEKRRVAC